MLAVLCSGVWGSRWCWWLVRGAAWFLLATWSKLQGGKDRMNVFLNYFCFISLYGCICIWVPTEARRPSDPLKLEVIVSCQMWTWEPNRSSARVASALNHWAVSPALREWIVRKTRKKEGKKGGREEGREERREGGRKGGVSKYSHATLVNLQWQESLDGAGNKRQGNRKEGDPVHRD